MFEPNRSILGKRFFPAALLCASIAACGGDEKPANTGQPPPQQCPPGQFFNGQYCQQNAPQPPPPGAQPAQQAPPPGPPPVATGTAGPAATPLDKTASQAATQGLAQLAKDNAPPGARPIGDAIAGQFQQGQSLDTVVAMTAGKCYTVVAAGLPPIQNVDLQMLPSIGLPMAPVLAQDQTAAPTAVIGKQPNCFKAMLSGPVKVVLTVSSGQGVAAAQVYEK